MLPDQPGELNEVHIGLASESDYVKAGIEHRTPPDLIKFRLVEGKDGIPVIEVTSQAPIKEPLLDFILEVNWPDGHLMREYTVLLDPPAATREAAAPAQAPAAGRQRERPWRRWRFRNRQRQSLHDRRRLCPLNNAEAHA